MIEYDGRRWRNHYRLVSLDRNVQSLIDQLGAAERIRATV